MGDFNYTVNQGDNLLKIFTNKADENGYVKDSSASVDMNSVFTALEEVNTEEQKNDGTKLYHGGNERGNWQKNFIVFVNQVIDLTSAQLEKIYVAMGYKKKEGVGVNESPTTNPTRVSSTENVEQSNEVKSQNPNLTLEQNMQIHKEVVDKAVELLIENFEVSGLGKHFKTKADKDLFLQCLKKVAYDKEKTGAGHAEAGVIHIETNNLKVNTLAEMTKLLIHEANHAFLQRKSERDGTLNFPTKNEEIECETMALTTMAWMVQNVEGMEDYEIYGKNISEYTTSNTVQSNPEFINWLDGYQQLADNLDGDITIKHCKENDNGNKIQIKKGDVITYEKNGREVTNTIGDNAFFEGRSNSAIAQLIMHKNWYEHKNDNNGSPELMGDFVFNDLEPTNKDYEIAYNNQCKAEDFTKIPVTIKRLNPTTGQMKPIYTGYKLEHK